MHACMYVCESVVITMYACICVNANRWNEESAENRQMYIARELWIPANLGQLRKDKADVRMQAKVDFSLLKSKLVVEKEVRLLTMFFSLLLLSSSSFFLSCHRPECFSVSVMTCVFVVFVGCVVLLNNTISVDVWCRHCWLIDAICLPLL
jgi:hypothetical protein